MEKAVAALKLEVLVAVTRPAGEDTVMPIKLPDIYSPPNDSMLQGRPIKRELPCGQEIQEEVSRVFGGRLKNVEGTFKSKNACRSYREVNEALGPNLASESKSNGSTTGSPQITHVALGADMRRRGLIRVGAWPAAAWTQPLVLVILAHRPTH